MLDKLADEDVQKIESGDRYNPWASDKYDWYAGYGFYVRPVSILEVGVRYGYSLLAMLYGTEAAVALVTMIDDGTDGPSLKQAEARIHAAFPDFIGLTRLVNINTQTEAHKFRSNTQYGIVHIDACHTYRGCLNDLMNFARFARVPDGIVVVDDAQSIEIRRAAEEFAEYQGWTTRYIDNYDGHIVMMRDA